LVVFVATPVVSNRCTVVKAIPAFSAKSRSDHFSIAHAARFSSGVRTGRSSCRIPAAAEGLPKYQGLSKLVRDPALGAFFERGERDSGAAFTLA
jgi:hypothetical protein